jgi:hypothetical protein
VPQVVNRKMRHTCSSQGGVVAKTSAEGETGRFWWTFILTTYNLADIPDRIRTYGLSAKSLTTNFIRTCRSWPQSKEFSKLR